MGRHKHPHSSQPTTTTMQHRGYVVFLGLISALSIHCSEKLDSANEKAASPLINCGCQCSSLTFRDANGVVQGNCLTVDSTGAQWCYVDQAYSSCQDLVPSKRFPIQEIFGANGGYDPGSIGEPRQGDASSKINLP